MPRLLTSLLNQQVHGLRLEIVVCVNGSTDGTAPVARRFVDRFRRRGHQLTVLELATASKANALNAGDQAVTSFPRLYLDADIALSPDAVRRTVEALRATSRPMLAAPRIVVAHSNALAARAYGRVWSALPYIRSHVPGVGFYAVNEAGRRRWWRFPTRMGADDKFVRLHFDGDEAVVIDDAWFEIYLPERLVELLSVRGRWTSFNREIARSCPGLARRDDGRWASSARHLASNPSSWPDVPTFLAVWSGAWVLALLRDLGVGRGWSRATSSPRRGPVPATSAREGCAAEPARELGTRPPNPVRPRAPARSVHAVVVTHNSIDTAPRSIERLLESGDIHDLRVTVVDNASSDGGAELLAARFPGIDVVSNRQNVGFAAAVNRALERTTARWLVLVNPDAEIRSDTIASCLAYLEEREAVGCCGVPAVRSDGRVNDRSFFMRPTLWSELTLGLGAHRISPRSRLLNPEQSVAHRELVGPLDVDAVSGCFCVIDRDLFDHLGGFDEEYFLCGEDLDLGQRAVEAGAAPTVLPVAPIVHHSEGSFPSRADARVAYLRGRAQYQRRWWPARRAAVASAIRTSGILARLVVTRVLRSARREELEGIWSRRGEWSDVSPQPLRSSVRGRAARPVAEAGPADGEEVGPVLEVVGDAV